MKGGPCRRSDVNWVVIEGDAVLCDPRTGEVHVISGATAATWQLIDGEPLDGLAELVADEFGIDLAVAAADLAESIAQLDSIGVVERP
jgi:hypothetical protein